MDYTSLSLADIHAGLGEVARDAQTTFGGLDARQLNWQPDATRWSVAHCFAHLITAHQLMFLAADEAMGGAPPTFWQRVPVLPRVWGWMLVRSQAPTDTRRYTAPAKARPAANRIPADVVQRFVQQQHDAAARVRLLDERDAARTIMRSPFFPIIAYSVLDSWRLVYAHGCRHVEQARRVTRTPGFPAARDHALA